MGLLDDVMIAAPCPAKWEEMQGDDVKRFCDKCALNVYNTSELTGQEIIDLMEQSEGRTCLRLYRRQDGTLITKDCPVGTTMRERIERARRRMQMAAAVVLAFLHVPGAMAQNRQNDNKAVTIVDGGIMAPAADGSFPGPLAAPAPTLTPTPAPADQRGYKAHMQAMQLKSAGDLQAARDKFEEALQVIDQQTKRDPKYSARVAGDYNKLLKQMGNKARSKEIVKKYGLK